MDIHGPQGPIHSVKHFFLHLLTITIGVLIALSLEGVVEWAHHRSLVSEARMNLASEIRDNKVELDKALAASDSTRQQLERSLEIANGRLAGKKVDVDKTELNYVFAELTAGSRATAETTGALSFMSYMDIKRYTDLYAMQQEFLHLQDHMLESVVAAIQVGDPTVLNASELEAWRHDLQTAKSYLFAETTAGSDLSKRYALAAAW